MNEYTKALISYFETLVTPNKLQRMHEVLAQRTRKISVVIEEPYHDANVSAILRSAEGFGVQDIHLIESYNQSSFKVGIARGSDQWLSISRHTEKNASETCLQKFKEDGYRVVATVPDRDALSISDVSLDKPIALVFGNERLGISQTVREQADIFATIPMVGFTESLNVSVAAGTILYDLVHRLKKERNDWRLSTEEIDHIKLQWFRIIINSCEEHEKRFLEQFTK